MRSDPISVEHEGHRTLLKWHRGRRKASDPEFTPTRILEAMQLGASVEVDLVVMEITVLPSCTIWSSIMGQPDPVSSPRPRLTRCDSSTCGAMTERR